MKNILNPTSTTGQISIANWKEIVARYQTPCIGRASWQLLNTLIPYLGLWVAMYFLVTICGG